MIQVYLDSVEIVLLSTLFFFLIIQLVYYWVFLARPYFYLQKSKRGRITYPWLQPPVSIIIYARDDSSNLQAILPVVLEQNYPEYEVIVVYDDSTDNSENVLKRLRTQYEHLYYTYVPQGTKNLSRKKLGLTLGIKAAKYNTLLFTDADSCPVSADWVSNMAKHFNDKKKIVIGFTAFDKCNSFGYKYAAYDYYFTNLQVVSMALLKFSFGANGKNLAYRKEYFESRKGYSKYRYLDAGEDDLFINEIATKENRAVELSPESIVVVKWVEMFDWKHFKIKRATSQHLYKKIPVLFWRFEAWSRFFFLASVLACFFYNFWQILLPLSAIIAFICRLFSQLFVINKTAVSLKLKKFYFLLPFFDLMQPIVNIYFYIYRLFNKKNE
jgi:cellulose synthase/poly-beta-1,6-N-acetylglucosamine synthase-like glycosyltransferase